MISMGSTITFPTAKEMEMISYISNLQPFQFSGLGREGGEGMVSSVHTHTTFTSAVSCTRIYPPFPHLGSKRAVAREVRDPCLTSHSQCQSSIISHTSFCRILTSNETTFSLRHSYTQKSLGGVARNNSYVRSYVILPHKY